MQIKKSVINDFQLSSSARWEDAKIDLLATESVKDAPTSKNTSSSSSSSSTGMSFFEQSIYAIEEFVAVRKKLGMGWK